ncbi:MAG: 50S ribosomal protein L24 [Coriobacteriia bacterium]|nr:50S ribosomal protein L24 [Coriobacteriia bacterium]
MRIRKGDRVRVITGKDKGKEGKVLSSDPEKKRLVVENVNMIKKHARPTQRNPQGGIIEREGTIHVSDVMLVCPSCSEPSRVGVLREDGARIRTCKECGTRIDK